MYIIFKLRSNHIYHANFIKTSHRPHTIRLYNFRLVIFPSHKALAQLTHTATHRVTFSSNTRIKEGYSRGLNSKSHTYMCISIADNIRLACEKRYRSSSALYILRRLVRARAPLAAVLLHLIREPIVTTTSCYNTRRSTRREKKTLLGFFCFFRLFYMFHRRETDVL